jgi:exodeoxyribonuclease VII small subunit
MENKNSNISFEKALKRLEEIAASMERDDLTLEQSLEIFQEGMELAAVCHGKLEEAEKRINVLSKNKNGELLEEKLDIEEE